ncbi:MAG: hypothetical protein RQ875_12195 [Vicingaceae bacterium]|nr:hypothetical protein [Vicingaceae bacterium]
MFNIDFRDISNKWIEPDLRQPAILDFIYSIIKPFKTSNNFLQVFRDEINYKLLFNGQVIYIEHYLNDVYDPILRRIFISDAERAPINYLFNKLESRPKTYLYNKSEGQVSLYMYNTLEYNGTITFWVNVPASITFNQIVMTNQIDVYRMAGKQFGFKIIP